MSRIEPPKRASGRPRDHAHQQRRRAHILDQAAEIFAHRGYRQTDIQAIADACEIAKGTIYRYFPSKAQLFLATTDHVMAQLTARIDQAWDQTTDGMDRIAEAVRGYLAYFDAHPHVVELLIQERAEFRDRDQPTYFAHREKNIGRWRGLVAQMIDQGRLRPMEPDRFLDVLCDLLYGTIFTNYFAGRQDTFERQADAILQVLFHGISTREAPGQSPDADERLSCE